MGLQNGNASTPMDDDDDDDGDGDGDDDEDLRDTENLVSQLFRMLPMDSVRGTPIAYS